ncbi:MAG: type I restriction enzyme HsdR N-terminal domain-containing protein [Proteobacteria bacterium]|nr:type I restriction enzyme HsdR N-terminal domain-containing protein [Pseudomonadota bacterium]
MNGHHLILGELVDYITGKTLKDTHDERYRQKIARLLVDTKGYSKKDIVTNHPVTIAAGHQKAVIRLDFLVIIFEKYAMLIRYAPGSIVTRRRPAIAASRVTMPYQIPVVVATNGEDAESLSGSTGQILFKGLDAIPSRTELETIMANDTFDLVSPEKVDMEARILYAFDVDDKCPCDDTTCVETFTDEKTPPNES